MRDISESPEFLSFKAHLMDSGANTDDIAQAYFGLICRSVGFTKRIWNVVDELVEGDAKAAKKYFTDYLKNPKPGHLELIYEVVDWYAKDRGGTDKFLQDFIFKDLLPLGFQAWCKTNSPKGYLIIFSFEERMARLKAKFREGFFDETELLRN